MADKNDSGKAKAAHKSPKSKSKSQVYKDLAEMLKGKCGPDHIVKPKDVATFFTSLHEYIKKELSKKGPGVLTLPGLVKLQRVHKAATKGGMQPNRFKPGEMMMVKPKPARTVVKVRPMKNLKDLVS